MSSDELLINWQLELYFIAHQQYGWAVLEWGSLVQQPHTLSSRAEEQYCLWGRPLQNNHNCFGHGLIAVAIVFLDDVTPSLPSPAEALEAF